MAVEPQYKNGPGANSATQADSSPSVVQQQTCIPGASAVAASLCKAGHTVKLGFRVLTFTSSGAGSTQQCDMLGQAYDMLTA